MAARTLTYFAADVHLGLDVHDPAAREKRFVDFLRSIDPERTESLYLLGDIWDFWYEYRDVVPKGYVRVFAALMDLMDAGVKVFFFQGNHDIWAYHYFESMGMVKLQQPYLVEIAGKTFCLGHGDGLGPGNRWYKFMRWGFRHPFFQGLFSLLHPTLAFWFGNSWSRHSRLSKDIGYDFKGESEPLWQFADAFSREHKVDYFIFGHFHCRVDMPVGTGARLLVLKDWMEGSSYIVFDGTGLQIR